MAPIIILFEPVVKAKPASNPMAVLFEPVLVCKLRYPSALLPVPVKLSLNDVKPTAVLLLAFEFVNAFRPIATLALAFVLAYRAPTPTAVFSLPLVFENKTDSPKPAFLLPEVKLGIVFAPKAVFLIPVCAPILIVGLTNEFAPNEVFALLKTNVTGVKAGSPI